VIEINTVLRRVCISLLCLLPVAWFQGTARAESVASADDELLLRYAPSLASPQQSTECGSGEAFTPISIDAILGRSDVQLKTADGQLIQTAPTAADLFVAGPNAHLDFPGNALNPGCEYEKWFQSLNATPTIYGRVVSDPQENNKIALQYWFFWPFNDWNNRHEGDWEMMQINFAVSTAQEALQVEPESVILAQHEGGEIQKWKDISLLSDRPLVFPAEGSHATYFSANRWVGTSAQTGVGCDDTRTPSRVLTPQVIALPREMPTSPADPFAWLAYEGRWGEQHSGFNNGPTGPTTKKQWNNPIEWSNTEGRAGSIALPPIGAPAADFFCGASERLSTLLLDALDRPWRVLTSLAIALGLVVWAIRRTHWTPASPLPINQRRRNGMIWSTSWRYLWLRRGRVLPFIALLVAGGALAQWLRQLVFRVTSTGDLSDPLNPNVNAVGGLSYGVWLIVLLPIVAIAVAGITRVMQLDENKSEDDVGNSLGHVMADAITPQRFIPSFVFTVFLFGIALLQVVLFWLTPRWILAPAFAPDKHPFRQAARLTKGRRRHIIIVSFITVTAVTAIGPLIGAVLLLTTTYSLGLISAITATINAVLVAWGVVALNYLHADMTLRVEQHEAR
jgi:hypothetical protein